MSGGLHGVGVSVVNALSEWLEGLGQARRQEHYMDFARGDTTTKLKELRRRPEEGDRHQVVVQARRRDLHGAHLPLRHARDASARALVPHQGRDDHAQRRARRAGEVGDLPREGRPQGVRAVPQHDAQAAAHRGHLHRDDARRRRHRARACSTTTATTRTSSPSSTTSTRTKAARTSPASRRR